MEGEKDAAQIESLKERIGRNYSGQTIKSHSFDKGFYSKLNLETLQQHYTEQPILPKKGKLNKGRRKKFKR